MPHLKSWIFAAAALGVVAAPAFAADKAMEKAVKVRKAHMQLYSWNLGALGAMAKGEVDYDATRASEAATDLVALTALNQAGLWPPGSDSTAMPGVTRAKSELWSTYPQAVEKSKAMSEAAVALAAVAGDGLPALQGAIGAVGQSCGGCHKPFREEE